MCLSKNIQYTNIPINVHKSNISISYDVDSENAFPKIENKKLNSNTPANEIKASETIATTSIAHDYFFITSYFT